MLTILLPGLGQGQFEGLGLGLVTRGGGRQDHSSLDHQVEGGAGVPEDTHSRLVGDILQGNTVGTQHPVIDPEKNKNQILKIK